MVDPGNPDGDAQCDNATNGLLGTCAMTCCAECQRDLNCVEARLNGDQCWLLHRSPQNPFTPFDNTSTGITTILPNRGSPPPSPRPGLLWRCENSKCIQSTSGVSGSKCAELCVEMFDCVNNQCQPVKTGGAPKTECDQMCGPPPPLKKEDERASSIPPAGSMELARGTRVVVRYASTRPALTELPARLPSR